MQHHRFFRNFLSLFNWKNIFSSYFITLIWLKTVRWHCTVAKKAIEKRKLLLYALICSLGGEICACSPIILKFWASSRSLKVFLFVSILCGTNTTSILSILKYWKRCKITNKNKLKDRETQREERERERGKK